MFGKSDFQKYCVMKICNDKDTFFSRKKHKKEGITKHRAKLLCIISSINCVIGNEKFSDIIIQR